MGSPEAKIGRKIRTRIRSNQGRAALASSGRDLVDDTEKMGRGRRAEGVRTL